MIHRELHQFLLSMKEVGERLPACPDVEGMWEEIAKVCIPEELMGSADYPTASLGWMMYVGMAVAKYLDEDRENCSGMEDLYAFLKEKRGYDSMDGFLRENILSLKGVDDTVLEKLTDECSSRVYGVLCRQAVGQGTAEAFDAYISCLHQLYLFGAAIQLNRMGHHETETVGYNDNCQ